MSSMFYLRLLTFLCSLSHFVTFLFHSTYYVNVGSGGTCLDLFCLLSDKTRGKGNT
jgi:hypothetical protein